MTMLMSKRNRAHNTGTAECDCCRWDHRGSSKATRKNRKRQIKRIERRMWMDWQ